MNIALTAEEIDVLNNAERLTTEVWKIVAKEQGCTWEQYRTVPYHLRLVDLQGTFDRIKASEQSQ